MTRETLAPHVPPAPSLRRYDKGERRFKHVGRGPRLWENTIAVGRWLTCIGRVATNGRTDRGNQARMACISAPTPRIAITRFML